MPLRPRIPERQTHDYIRHWTTCLYAALRLLDGVVLGAYRPKRDTKEFVRFLTRVEHGTTGDHDIHVILDNLSTHKSPPVHRWLRRHYNEAPRRFIWTKDADMILDKIAKCPKPLAAAD